MFLLVQVVPGKILAIGAPEIMAEMEARRSLIINALGSASGMKAGATGLALTFEGNTERGDYLLGRAAGDDPKCEEHCSCNPPVCGTGAGYWSLPTLIRAYFMFRPGATYQAGQYAGRITQTTANGIKGFYQNYLRKGAGKGYGDCNSCAGESTIDAYQNSSPYTYISQTDNHTMIQASSILLGSQILKGSDAGALVIYNNWRGWWLKFLDGLAKRGFYEIASPTYVDRHLAPLYNLYDFAEDGLIRKKAQMLIDQYWTEIALDLNNGIRTGAKTRVYGAAPGEGDRGAGSARNDCLYPIYYLYFGEGDYAADQTLPNSIQYGAVFATSSYVPPGVVLELGVNEQQRGSYELKERRKGSCFVFNADNLAGLSYNSRRYAWVTPDYTLGSFQSDADKQFMAQAGQAVGLQYGLWFPTHPEAKINLGSSGAQTNGQIESFQYKNTLIISSVATYGDATPHPAITVALPARPFSESVSESGWRFIRENQGYAAIKTVQDNLVIIEAGRQTDDGSFADFKNHIKLTQTELSPTAEFIRYRNSAGIELYFPLKRSSEEPGIACHYTCDCHPSVSRLPQVNGQVVDWPDYPYFGSPYVNADWDSGLVRVNFNGQFLGLDFTDPQNPVKTEGQDNCPDRERGNFNCDLQGLINGDDIRALIDHWGIFGDEKKLTLVLKNWTYTP